MTTEQRTTLLGRTRTASTVDQLTDPVVLTRLATVALSAYLPVILGITIVSLVAVIVVGAVGVLVSTEFGRRGTVVERVLARRRGQQ